MPLTDSWAGCYGEGWGSRLRPASYAHPAKNSYGLSVRIYEHALAEGWVKAGDYVVDCFSGVGGFALEAMRHGLHFRGVELEQRFVDMGQGCDCTGISKEDWARYQGRWDRMRYKDGPACKGAGRRHWCPECLMKAGAVADEREFKPLPLPGTKWAALAKTHQPTLFAAAPTASYVRNSGKIPCTGAHRYHGNIETWEQDGMEGTAVIVQGDSRRLGEVLERARICVSSPPFGNTLGKGGETKGFHSYDKDEAYNRCKRDYVAPEDPANLGNLPDTGFEAALAVASPPFGAAETRNRTPFQGGDVADMMSRAYTQDRQGPSPGQLAQMPEGDLVAVISSPPFLAQPGGTNVTAQSGPLADASLLKRHSAGNQAAEGYGISAGQLAALPEGDHAEACLPEHREAGAVTPACADRGRAQAVISSPPWESNLDRASMPASFLKKAEAKHKRSYSQASFKDEDYGATAGQLGQETGSTFWAASRAILEEVYKVLAPGAHAIFVCKRFVRNKAIVDFPLQWAHLCEAVGFTWIHHHKAWLVEDRGAQHTLEGGLEERQVKRMSFFRRLHAAKYPHLEILWEDVLCFVKEPQ